MGVGYQAFTDTGLFQIDGLTPNYQLIQRMTQSTALTNIPTVFNNVQQQYYANFWWTSFTFYAITPLFAFTADNGAMVTPWKFNRSGNTFTAEFVSAVGPVNINLFVFDQVAPTNGKFGLQVFSAAAALLADAASPFAKVIDVRAGQVLGGSGFDGTGTSMPGPGTQAVDYGRPVAIAAARAGHLMNTTGPDGTWLTAWSVTNGSVITWEWHAYYNNSGGHYVGFREASIWQFMVLDMTGIV